MQDQGRVDEGFGEEAGYGEMLCTSETWMIAIRAW